MNEFIQKLQSDKAFADEAFPRIIETANQPKARKGFIYECLGQYAEAIECYESMGEDKPEDRIEHLRELVKQA